MSKSLSGVRADHKLSYAKLEKRAEYVREVLGIASDSHIDPAKLFEDLDEISVTSGNVSIPLRGGVIEIEDSEGYTHYDKKRSCIEILASTQVYEWLERGHPRAAYFVAHELGHCLLHTEQLVRLAQMPTNQQAAFHRGLAVHRAFEDTEWQANNFASALLMPAKGIFTLEERFGELQEHVLASAFRVSYEAAGFRLRLFNERRSELLG